MKLYAKWMGIGLVGLTTFSGEPGQKGAPAAGSSKAFPESKESASEAAPKVGAQAVILPSQKASSMIGMKVKDATGKEAGKLKELVFDLANGKVGYAIIALNGDRLVPVPLSALNPDETGKSLILNMTPAVLAAAPGVGNDEWPAVDTFAVGSPAGAETGQGSSRTSVK